LVSEDLLHSVQKLANSDFQMNTHAIGDSANAVLFTYYDVLKGQKRP
jgi:predicted amidohydrolase YtcJ